MRLTAKLAFIFCTFFPTLNYSSYCGFFFRDSLNKIYFILEAGFHKYCLISPPTPIFVLNPQLLLLLFIPHSKLQPLE